MALISSISPINTGVSGLGDSKNFDTLDLSYCSGVTDVSALEIYCL